MILNFLRNILSSPYYYEQNRDELPSIFNSVIKDEANGFIDFSEFKGKKILIVNTASSCSFTKQYSELQELYELNIEKLVILAFPCNDFASQEKLSDSEIRKFCSTDYGVTFPVYKKIKMERKSAGLFHWLSDEKLNGWNHRLPAWNFWKYMLDEEGRLIGVFPSKVRPYSIPLNQ